MSNINNPKLSQFLFTALAMGISIPTSIAQGLVGPPAESRYGCDPVYLSQQVNSSTEYLPILTVLITLAVGIFILRARSSGGITWSRAAQDLGLLFGVPAMFYVLWQAFTAQYL